MSHVLIVDDSEDIRLALRTILEDAGYEIKELSDGTEVLGALQTDPPDLVLLDVAMPLKDGFETLKEIIADEQTRDIPVIMVTANFASPASARPRTSLEVPRPAASRSRPASLKHLRTVRRQPGQ